MHDIRHHFSGHDRLHAENIILNEVRLMVYLQQSVAVAYFRC
jgi:hypothetical protein